MSAPSERIAAALEVYLDEAEAGAPPDRETFLARFPDLAGPLDAALEALEAVRRNPVGDEDLLLLRVVGGFQVLAIIARGGMGTVYRAVELELGRLVALKVRHEGSRERFYHEARVAASLHHTHIVGVLAFGSVDGFDYYALPFIDGPSLAQALREMGTTDGPRSPIGDHLHTLSRSRPTAYYRLAAELTVQAAEALAFAHGHGVVHRDVKPGNLLLELDAAGQPHLWLHDFGLARREGDDDLARPGTPFGTPGYSSPEQAAGRVEEIDTVSDVYSLGVTLAELLGSLDSAVPRDLTWVVQRATAARREDRYQTAQALADDLRRYLTGYPLRARPPSPWDHVAKWILRQRRVLAAAAVTLMAATALGGTLLYRSYLAERTARERSERHERLATQALNAHSPLVDDLLFKTPGMLEKQRELLESVREVNREMLADRPGERWLQERQAQVEWRLARVYRPLGRQAEAEAALRESVRLFEAVTAAEPAEPLHGLDLARSYSLLGDLLVHQGRRDEADDASRAALAVVRGLARRVPEDLRVRDALACYANERAAFVLSQGDDRVEAARLTEEALTASRHCWKAKPDRWQYGYQVLQAQRGLASLRWTTDDVAGALAVGEDALTTSARLIEQAEQSADPSRTAALADLRKTRLRVTLDQAARLLDAERRDAAAEHLSGGLAEAERYSRSQPDEARIFVAEFHRLTGWHLFLGGDEAKAGEAFHRYGVVLEAWHREQPKDILPLEYLTLLRTACPVASERNAAAALKWAETAMQLDPDDSRALLARGTALVALGRFETAADPLGRAVTLAPRKPEAHLRLALCHAGRGDAVAARRALGAARALVPRTVPVEFAHLIGQVEAHLKK